MAPLKDVLAEYERRLIAAALRAQGGHQRRAAASLGVLPSTLVEKMKRLGIPGARSGSPPSPPDSLSAP